MRKGSVMRGRQGLWGCLLICSARGGIFEYTPGTISYPNAANIAFCYGVSAQLHTQLSCSDPARTPVSPCLSEVAERPTGGGSQHFA